MVQLADSHVNDCVTCSRRVQESVEMVTLVTRSVRGGGAGDEECVDPQTVWKVSAGNVEKENGVSAIEMLKI